MRCGSLLSICTVFKIDELKLEKLKKNKNTRVSQ